MSSEPIEVTEKICGEGGFECGECTLCVRNKVCAGCGCQGGCFQWCVFPGGDGLENPLDGLETQEEWQQIYQRRMFSEVGGDIEGTYYETYGGGPEGGYVVTSDSRVYKVDRNWGKPWTIHLMPSNCVLHVRPVPDAPSPEYCECCLERKASNIEY